jgi:hypothetical protein
MLYATAEAFHTEAVAASMEVRRVQCGDRKKATLLGRYPGTHRPYACHQTHRVLVPEIWCRPHHEIIAALRHRKPSVHSESQNLHIRGEYSHDTWHKQLPHLPTNLTFKSILLFQTSSTPITYSTCLPTSAAQASTRLLTSAPSQMLRSSKRRTRTASTRARSTRTRRKTPVCSSFLYTTSRRTNPTIPRDDYIMPSTAANNIQQRTSDQSPTSSSARESARTRMRRSPSRTGSANKTPLYPPAPTATSPPREPRSTRS